jgi:hypothetical protein
MLVIGTIGTIAKGAALLHQEGAREVYACSTHAVFRYCKREVGNCTGVSLHWYSFSNIQKHFTYFSCYMQTRTTLVDRRSWSNFSTIYNFKLIYGCILSGSILIPYYYHILKSAGNRKAIKWVISGGHYNKYYTIAWAEKLSSTDSSVSCKSIRRDHLACSRRLLCQQHISMNKLDFLLFLYIYIFKFFV